jgi:hypothetical protein
MNAISESSVPVLCDQCGAAGLAGSGGFSDLGDLLDFKAVPRQLKRRDGWTGVLQREFIARLARTGSPTLAVEAMGKCLHGVKKLLKDPGSDGFRDAWERAVEIGEAAEARRRIAEQAGIDERGAHLTAPRRRSGWDSEDGFPDPVDPEEEGMSEDGKIEILARLITKFTGKVARERAARIGGRIVEADFYLRQITCLEISFDLLAEGQGMDAWQAIALCRRGGHGILEIGDTVMSRLLDDARRGQWAKMGEPQRPEHPPARFLTDHGDHRTEAAECLGPASPPLPGHDPEAWAAMSYEEQKAAQIEQYKRDAAEQVEWEARNAAEAAEWRAAHNDSSAPGSPGEGDQP